MQTPASSFKPPGRRGLELARHPAAARPWQAMKSHHHRAIEHLARESQIPVNEVARLYEDARARLAVGARISSFIGIFALRHVRKALRQRKPAAPSPLR